MNRLKTWKIKPTRNSGDSSVLFTLYRSLYQAAVLTAALALVMTVATRYTDHVDAGAQVSCAVVHHSLENQQQHVEKTSLVWIFPPSSFGTLKPSTLAARVIQQDHLRLTNLASPGLYSRPPPSFC